MELEFLMKEWDVEQKGCKNKDWSQITIHSTILEDRYKRLVKTDKIHSFFYIFRFGF